MAKSKIRCVFIIASAIFALIAGSTLFGVFFFLIAMPPVAKKGFSILLLFDPRFVKPALYISILAVSSLSSIWYFRKKTGQADQLLAVLETKDKAWDPDALLDRVEKAFQVYKEELVSRSATVPKPIANASEILSGNFQDSFIKGKKWGERITNPASLALMGTLIIGIDDRNGTDHDIVYVWLRMREEKDGVLWKSHSNFGALWKLIDTPKGWVLDNMWEGISFSQAASIPEYSEELGFGQKPDGEVDVAEDPLIFITDKIYNKASRLCE